MTKTNIIVEKGDVYKVTVPANSSTVPNSAVVWLIGDGIQDQLISSLAASSEKVLGPFLNTVNYRVETKGAVTIEKIGAGNRSPISIFDYAPALEVADGVADATDEVDVVTLFNELKANLVTAGYVAEFVE